MLKPRDVEAAALEGLRAVLCAAYAPGNGRELFRRAAPATLRPLVLRAIGETGNPPGGCDFPAKRQKSDPQNGGVCGRSRECWGDGISGAPTGRQGAARRLSPPLLCEPTIIY